MKRLHIFITCFFLLHTMLNAQTSNLKINPGIVLPEDSMTTEALLLAVNEFLSFAESNTDNKWVLQSERVETQVLIDEIQDIRKNKELDNDTFYEAYLTKVTPLEKEDYAVHIAYIGINEQMAVLRANFELIANHTKDGYLISSPLKRNTQHWETKKIGNYSFFFPYSYNAEKLDQYCDLTLRFDEKLKIDDKESHFYLCESEIDPLKLFGVEYKFDYNGQALNSSWESSSEKKNLLVLNADEFYDFDTHDLWHYRLSQVISRRKVHNRVDCYIATIYGGLWGKSWEELFPIFTEKYVTGKDVDWLELKTNKAHFVLDKRKNYSDDFVGALIVKRIEKEKGFEGVWELLNTKRTTEEEQYFAVLEDLIGINKKNYNRKVFKLIEEEMNNFGI